MHYESCFCSNRFHSVQQVYAKYLLSVYRGSEEAVGASFFTITIAFDTMMQGFSSEGDEDTVC